MTFMGLQKKGCEIEGEDGCCGCWGECVLEEEGVCGLVGEFGCWDQEEGHFHLPHESCKTLGTFLGTYRTVSVMCE